MWDALRKPDICYTQLEQLADEIVQQMFEHWDFPAQLQGSLRNDLRVPASIGHMFPIQHHPRDQKLIQKRVRPEEMEKFEEIRQFFYLYETTGCNMTHCSLMGSTDMFTKTGK